MRVALFGELGVGNAGNDASAAAVLELFERAVPGVRVQAIARDVQGTKVALGIEAVPIESSVRLSRWGRAGRGLAKAADLGHLVRAVHGFDAVVVPGTGMLEQPSGRLPNGVLLWLLALSAACRLRRVPLVWFAIGGSRVPGSVAARVAVLAARGATVRSYRDALTARTLAGAGLRADDAVVRDVVLSRPEALTGVRREPSSTGRRVGVSVIDYRPRAGGTDDAVAARRAAYQHLLADAVQVLVAQGFEVVPVVADLADVGPTGAVAALSGIETGDLDASSFDELLRAVARCDVVVASRYHVLVAAALARVPVVALSHADKDEQLAGQLGFEAVPVEDASAASLVAAVLAAHEDADALRARLDRACTEAHALVTHEFAGVVLRLEKGARQ